MGSWREGKQGALLSQANGKSRSGEILRGGGCPNQKTRTGRFPATFFSVFAGPVHPPATVRQPEASARAGLGALAKRGRRKNSTPVIGADFSRGTGARE
jgi:hypothetical protein